MFGYIMYTQSFFERLAHSFTNKGLHALHLEDAG